MDCIINPVNNQPSELQEELNSYFSNNVKESERVYNIILSGDFAERFGDWQNGDEITKGRISPTGEPLLYTNSYRRKYFILKDGTKYWLDKKLLNYSYIQRKALVSTSIEYLFGGQVTSKKDIDSFNFSDLYKPETSKDNPNAAYIIFDGDHSSLQDLEELIRQYIGISSLEITDKEEALDSGISQDIVESNSNLELQQSFEKNSKDNASANIKFLLSFVPKFNINQQGEIELETVKIETLGEDVELVVYNDFNEIWNYFEETLSDILPYANGKYVTDVFDEMITTLRNKYAVNKFVNGVEVANINHNPTVIDAIENLIEPLSENKKNQFVHAFSKSKVNFYTTTIARSDEGIKMTFFNSGDVNSRFNKVKKEMINGLSSSILFDNTKNIYNQTLAQELKNKYASYFTKVRANNNKKNFTNNNLNKVTENIDKFLSKINFNVNNSTLLNYVDSFEEDSVYGNTIKAMVEIGHIFTQLADSTTKDFYTKKGFTNPLKDKKFIKTIAKLESEFRKDISENTVLGPENKKYWSYSLPNYLNIKLQKIKNNLANEVGDTAFYKNSLWINKFKEDSGKYLDDMEVLTFLNLKTTEGGDVGVDNKSIQQTDQIVDLFNKAILIKTSSEEEGAGYNYSIYNTPSPADKGKLLSFTSKIFTNTNLQFDDEGNVIFSKELVNIYKGYFLDEYNRSREVYDHILDENTLPTDLYQNYHYGDNENLFKEFNGKKIPAGNGFKFGLFSEFNYDEKTQTIDEYKKFIRSFSNNARTPLLNLSDDGAYLYPLLSDDDLLSNAKLEELIISKLRSMFDNSVTMLQDKGLVSENKGSINFIDKQLLDIYTQEANGDHSFATQRFISDSLFNQHISNIEYSKVFSGDYSYYKTFDDYSKRVPATYSDGVLLNLKPGDNATFNVAVLPDVFVNTELYKNVDATDAQGWITLDRWKFIQERLHKWDDNFENAYKKMKDGTATVEDYNYAAQPVKGVYFDVIKGRPTYLKYSQTVLSTQNIKEFGIEKLYNQMVKNGIDESVALSGVKVGAITTSDILNEDNTYKDKMNFHVMKLNNHSWKLQQDLSPKGIKNTLLGSQMKKNIIKDIQVNKDYRGQTGAQRIENIVRLLSDLSDMGKDKLEKELGLNSITGEITNRELFYKMLLKELMSNGSDINSIEALKKEYPLDLILTNRIKFQNLISSMVNNATVKLKTNGGSFIQMSSFGWDIKDAKKTGVKMLVDESKLKAPRVKTINGKKTVLPGQIFISHQEITKYIPNYTELSMEELNAKIDKKLLTVIGYRIPNQDLASNDALEIVGILPIGMGDTVIPYIDITKKTGSDFDIDKMYIMMPHMKVNRNKSTYAKARQFLARRFRGKTQEETISNMLQLLEDYNIDSISPDNELEIVNSILFATNEKIRKDVEIEVIEEIVFGNNELNKEYTEEFGLDDVISLEFYTDDSIPTKKGLENKLLTEFEEILTSHVNFKNLVTAIDNDFLKNDIKLLHGDGIVDSFEFFSPIHQMTKKFDNSAGKTGTGITANHSVDHAFAQIAGLEMNVDLGVGNVKNGKSLFNQIYDNQTGRNRTRISEVLSWFLTAYVDIAKDPYITRGNHNSVTSNVIFMLLRNGTSLSWLNRFVGQESIKKFVQLELNKDSKFNPNKKSSFKTVEADIKNKLQSLSKLTGIDFDNYYNSISEKLENIILLGDGIRKNDSFSNKSMENNIINKVDNLTYWENQLKYLHAFKAYNELGSKFNDTVIYSKADVNGSPSNIAALYTYKQGYKEMFKYKNANDEILFTGLAEKFTNTFLESTHENSIEVADKIFEKEMVTYSTVFGKRVLEAFYNANNKKPGFKAEFAGLESHLFGFIASKSSFFSLESKEVNNMFRGNNTMQSKVIEGREKHKDNLLLNNLIPFTQDGLQFISIDNLTNKPNSYKDDLMRAWDDLQEIDPDLSEDLLKYSYVTSNFSFNSQSFFEFAPHQLVKTVLEGSVEYFKNDNSSNTFIADFLETYSRNNSKNVTEFEFKTKYEKTGYSILDSKKFSNNLIIGEGTTGVNFIKSKQDVLFQKIGNLNVNVFVYKKIEKLGYSKKGYYIYENYLNESTIFESNKIKNAPSIQENVNKYILDETKWSNPSNNINIGVDKINYMSTSRQEQDQAIQRGLDNGLFQEICN